ncbi:MAG: YqiA/YcfP family alpha/beta fold hydrolase [Thiolinea sp.]
MQELLENEKVIEPFFIEFKDDFIHGNVITASGNSDAPEVLFIHGCNPVENSSDFLVLRQMLAEKYLVSSCAFDFPGHGNTGADWGESTIELRTAQSVDIINACFDSQPLSIVASGLGAYTAIKLTQLVTVNNLILLVPALCAYEACNINLGDNYNDFTELTYSWPMTDALSIIQFYEGGISILGAGTGSSTQREVAGQLFANALRAKERRAIDVFGKYGMSPMEYANHNPAVTRCILETITDLCGNPANTGVGYSANAA